MTTAYLGLGSNLGARRRNLEEALRLLDSDRVHITRVSAVIETEPMYVTEQPPFLNMAVEVDTDLTPEELLGYILEVERTMGRQRGADKGPRNIDIDLLLYGDAVIDRQGLTVPHPGMEERLFVLQPLAEIAAAVIHPIKKLSIGDLLLLARR